MNEEYIEEVLDSGEHLPAGMWEEDLSESILQVPVFNGEKIVDQGE